jgi:hypothetical protein
MAVDKLFGFVINFSSIRNFVKGMNVPKGKKKAGKKKLKVTKKATKDLEVAGKKVQERLGRSPLGSCPDPG